jgi:hypothetical protein
VRVVSIRISNLSLGYTPTEDGGPKYPNALSASGTGKDRRVGVLESFLFLWSNERNEFVLLKMILGRLIGSKQECHEPQILGCFLENEEFSVCDGHVLGLRSR